MHYNYLENKENYSSHLTLQKFIQQKEAILILQKLDIKNVIADHKIIKMIVLIDRVIRSLLSAIQFKVKRFFPLYYNQQQIKHMKNNQEGPFIILKNDQLSAEYEDLPDIKPRKPTKHTWTPYQNFLYVSFLRENMEAMESKQDRKNFRVFSLMAKQIKTRTSTQIKSHHQKLERKFGKIKTIISKVSQHISKYPFFMTKDMQTSTEIKVEYQERSQPQNQCYCQSLQQEDIGKRSQDLQFFFEQPSDIYLVFEGNRHLDNQESWF